MKKIIIICVILMMSLICKSQIINKTFFTGFTIKFSTQIGSTYLIQCNGQNSIAPLSGLGYPVSISFFVPGTYRILVNGFPRPEIINVQLNNGKLVEEEVTISNGQIYKEQTKPGVYYKTYKTKTVGDSIVKTTLIVL
jgi:hypothetical protein